MTKKIGGEFQINFPTKMEGRSVTVHNVNEGHFDFFFNIRGSVHRSMTQ